VSNTSVLSVSGEDEDPSKPRRRRLTGPRSSKAQPRLSGGRSPPVGGPAVQAAAAEAMPLANVPVEGNGRAGNLPAPLPAPLPALAVAKREAKQEEAPAAQISDRQADGIEDPDLSSLPLDARLASADWKWRKSAYDELGGALHSRDAADGSAVVVETLLESEAHPSALDAGLELAERVAKAASGAPGRPGKWTGLLLKRALTGRACGPGAPAGLTAGGGRRGHQAAGGAGRAGARRGGRRRRRAGPGRGRGQQGGFGPASAEQPPAAVARQAGDLPALEAN
jgi:hypothetical protein